MLTNDDLAAAYKIVSQLLDQEFSIGYNSDGESAEEECYLYGANVTRLMAAKEALGSVHLRKPK